MKKTIPIHTKADFAGMRKAGALACSVLDFIAPFVVEGVTTEQLNTLCHDFICDHGAIPAPLGYKGFPKSICTSVNHVVCHGIPSGHVLRKGDIVNIDVTVILDGWHGDTSRMFAVGSISAYAQRLIDVTRQCLDHALAVARPGATLGDIGHAIQRHAESHGFSVVRDFCGHGIGAVFHTEPEVPHWGKPGKGLVLQEGHFFTIEPMINGGSSDVRILKDGWTAVTRDGKLSAQFEHSIGITAQGCDIFTQKDNDLGHESIG